MAIRLTTTRTHIIQVIGSLKGLNRSRTTSVMAAMDILVSLVIGQWTTPTFRCRKVAQARYELATNTDGLPMEAVMLTVDEDITINESDQYQIMLTHKQM